MLEADFAVFNVDRLVTADPAVHPGAGGDLGVIERGALAARDGKIIWVGTLDELHARVRLLPDAVVLNPHGGLVLPGFVDPHTHPVFAGDRIGDFYRRIHGESYGEQVESGGMMRTVRATRETDEDTLLGLAFERVETFLRHGTTTIEAKTGYGLTREDELKSLRVLNRLQRMQALKIVPAYLAAHVVPSDYDGGCDAYVREIVDSWLPEAAPYAAICDTWCEEEAFTEAQCRAILERAREHGLGGTLHASELAPTGGVRLAVELGCLSVDHAVYLDDADIAALAGSDTVAVLLPGTTFFLGSHEYAHARRLLDRGVAVALGTDFNPGTSFTQNMQFILTLAVLELKMTPEEAILAATRTAARAVGLGDLAGSLTPGKYCDLVLYDLEDYRAIPYSYAMNRVDTVVAGGRVVVAGGRVTTEVIGVGAGERLPVVVG
jgi:imidazolonepropionase